MAGRRSPWTWDRLSALAELALIIGLLIGLFGIVHDSLDVSARLGSQSTSESASEIGEHQSLAGLNANGRSAHFYLRATARHAVVFVVRASSYQKDVGYWDAVAKLLNHDPLVWLLGYCNGSACNSFTKAASHPQFDLVAFGELEGLETAHHADAGGFALITDNKGTVTSRLKWRSEPPDAVAANLRQLK